MTIGSIIGWLEIWGPQLSRVVCLICLQVSTFLSVHFLDATQLSDNRMNWFISELFLEPRSTITTLAVLQWDIIPNLRAPLRVTYLGQMTHWLSDILSIHFFTATLDFRPYHWGGERARAVAHWSAKQKCSPGSPGSPPRLVTPPQLTPRSPACHCSSPAPHPAPPFLPIHTPSLPPKKLAPPAGSQRQGGRGFWCGSSVSRPGAGTGRARHWPGPGRDWCRGKQPVPAAALRRQGE